MVEIGSGCQPFVTIGVTTYNRHDLLRQTLNSILAQTFGDFEVIVGNDYTDEVLNSEMLGITDPRIRIVNHPHNLGEVGNMNALLGMASGRYFTWLFDDDLYEPNFLQTAHNCLQENDFPPAFFPAYGDLRVTDVYQPRHIPPRLATVLTGRQFLDGYFTGRLKIVSTCGLFDTARLRSNIGGVEELCDSAIGVYCEYLFLFRCALLERIVFMDAPFVLFNKHAGSWSENNTELDKYVAAGRELVRRCGEILRSPAFSDPANANLMGVCKLHLTTFAYKSAGVEIARKKYGAGAAGRALTRLRQEITRTRELFNSQSGVNGLRTELSFAKVKALCCGIILFQLAYYFYYDNFRPSA